MYDKVSTDLKFVDREREVLAFWKENKVFEKSVELRKGAPAYTVFDGPPTANGKPHIGHVLTRSIKDIIPRYRTMKGYDVLRKAGWDTHGLPVELEVEKELGLDGKEQIERYGVEPFIEGCKKSVWKYKSEWEDMSDRVGYWMDMDDPYVTYHDDYIESEWWALKTIYDKGLLYKGYKIVPYCPRCGTALSSHEVAQGYKDVKETSAIAKFYLTDGSGTCLLAYGPREAASMDYLIRNDAAFTATSAEELRGTLWRMCTDRDEYARIAGNARALARKNHDPERIREIVRQALSDAAEGKTE